MKSRKSKERKKERKKEIYESNKNTLQVEHTMLILNMSRQ